MNKLSRKNLEYRVLITETGSWLHAPGSDFLFAFIENDWSPNVQASVTKAFTDALKMSSDIKAAVQTTSGQDVVNGLYLLDQPAMTKAMNSINGMGQTSVDQKSESGSGTTIEINQAFFNAILGGLGGDVAPMLAYLTEEMGAVQAQTKKSTVTENFGTVVGFISVMPVLEVPVTSFQYVYSSQATSSWFVSVNCGSVQHYSYDYAFTVVNYNYIDPNAK